MGISEDGSNPIPGFIGPKKNPQNMALEAMIQQAEYKCLNKGVAFICDWKKGDPFPRTAFSVLKLERDPDPEKDPDDTGTNYFGVAMAKLAVMLSTQQDSGNLDRPLKVGEVPYRGGLCINQGDSTVYIGYSGGTEIQDVEIALTGYTVFKANIFI